MTDSSPNLPPEQTSPLDPAHVQLKPGMSVFETYKTKAKEAVDTLKQASEMVQGDLQAISAATENLEEIRAEVQQQKRAFKKKQDEVESQIQKMDQSYKQAEDLVNDLQGKGVSASEILQKLEMDLAGAGAKKTELEALQNETTDQAATLLSAQKALEGNIKQKSINTEINEVFLCAKSELSEIQSFYAEVKDGWHYSKII